MDWSGKTYIVEYFFTLCDDITVIGLIKELNIQ